MIDYNDFLRFLDKSKSEYNTLYPAKHVVSNEHGFVAYDIGKDTIWLWQLYGDGKYWYEYLSNECKKLGLRGIRGTTKRNPKAWNKRFNTKIIGYIIEAEINVSE